MKYEQIDESNNINKYALIDVRSPKEFFNATIPGAVNIPLFTDEQREIIGTVYVRESIEKAKKIGVEAASKNLPIIYEKINELDKLYKNLVFFCARGGMRSSSLVALLTPLGVNALKLENGYKGYRAYINEQLPTAVKGVEFVVIHDILDLEGCANHRGSLLGNVGLGLQNSQKQFESLIYNKLKNRKNNIIFVEGESKRIGKVIIPDCIFNVMKNGRHINLKANMDLRIKNILDDYVQNNNLEIIESLNKLRKYISSKNIDKYIEEINNNNYEFIIEELMLKYYDPMYENNKYDFCLTLEHKDIDETCDAIVNAIEDIAKEC
jgi:tRNA 2-selenouridine synthase